MRKCSKCGSEFQITGDKSWMCLLCRREYDKRWRAKRRAEGRPVITGKMPKSYHRDYNRHYYSRSDIKVHQAERMREYVTRDHVAPKVRARLDTRNAIRRGDLIRLPCEFCGDPKTHAHHHDYSKPLEVKWLCREHHEALHSAKTEGGQ